MAHRVRISGYGERRKNVPAHGRYRWSPLVDFAWPDRKGNALRGWILSGDDEVATHAPATELNYLFFGTEAVLLTRV